MTEDLFVPANTRDSLAATLARLKLDLFAGLRSVELQSFGWTDPTSNAAQSLWTNVNVATCLLQARLTFPNATALLKSVADARVITMGGQGWTSDYIPDQVSIYVTADVAEFYMFAGDSQAAGITLQELLGMQNTDGGWGICSGDVESKTRPTSLMLRILSQVHRLPALHTQQISTAIVGAVKWQTDAHVDHDGGWSSRQGAKNSDLSSTIDALGALAAVLVSNQTGLGASAIRTSQLQSAVTYVLRHFERGNFSGPPEEIVGYQVAGRKYSHSVSGLGPVSALSAVVDLINSKTIPPNHQLLAITLQEFKRRCVPIKDANGVWVYPSEQGGAPVVWNSGLAIETIFRLELLLIKLEAEGLVERTLRPMAGTGTNHWRTSTIALCVLLISALVVASGITESISKKFSLMSPLVQGLVLTVVGLVAQGIITWLSRAFKAQFENKTVAK